MFLISGLCKKCPGWDGEMHGPFDAQQRIMAPAEEGAAAGVATGSTTPAQGLGSRSVSCPPLLATPAQAPVFFLAEKKDCRRKAALSSFFFPPFFFFILATPVYPENSVIAFSYINHIKNTVLCPYVNYGRCYSSAPCVTHTVLPGSCFLVWSFSFLIWQGKVKFNHPTAPCRYQQHMMIQMVLNCICVCAF